MFFWRFPINRSTKTNLLLSNWPAHAFFSISTAEASTSCCRSKYSYVLPKKVRSKYAHANHQPLLALILSSTSSYSWNLLYVYLYSLFTQMEPLGNLSTFQTFKFMTQNTSDIDNCITTQLSFRTFYSRISKKLLKLTKHHIEKWEKMSLLVFVFFRAPERAQKEIYLWWKKKYIFADKRAAACIVTFNAFYSLTCIFGGNSE